MRGSEQVLKELLKGFAARLEISSLSLANKGVLSPPAWTHFHLCSYQIKRSVERDSRNDLSTYWKWVDTSLDTAALQIKS